MIKKRYIILSVMIVSVLLGSLFYVSITSAGKPVPQPDQVEVINFPLDEEGNLKVTQMDGEQNVTVTNFPLDENGNLRIKTPTYTSTIVLCEDLHIELRESKKFICSAYVEGWKEATVFIKTENADRTSYHYINFMANGISFQSTLSYTGSPAYDTGGSFKILGPYLEIYSGVLVGSDYVDITVVLYLQK